MLSGNSMPIIKGLFGQSSLSDEFSGFYCILRGIIWSITICSWSTFMISLFHVPGLCFCSTYMLIIVTMLLINIHVPGPLLCSYSYYWSTIMLLVHFHIDVAGPLCTFMFMFLFHVSAPQSVHVSGSHLYSLSTFMLLFHVYSQMYQHNTFCFLFIHI